MIVHRDLKPENEAGRFTGAKPTVLIPGCTEPVFVDAPSFRFKAEPPPESVPLVVFPREITGSIEIKFGRAIPARRPGVRIYRPSTVERFLRDGLGEPTTTSNSDGTYTHTMTARRDYPSLQLFDNPRPSR